MSIYSVVRDSLHKENVQNDELSKAITDGYAFFSKFNRNRMELAFSIFSDKMKKALFEVIFFLHVNEPEFEEHKFITTRVEKLHGVAKEVEYEEVTSLFVKDAPAGVVGIGDLSPVFKDEFTNFAQNEFGTIIYEKEGFAPIYSIASLGSIGTIGHKENTSDLDLQVQYELEPFLIELNTMTDQDLIEYANGLISFYSKKYQVIKKIPVKELQKKEVRLKIKSVGHRNFKSRFPLLYNVLFLRKKDIVNSVPKNKENRDRLANELLNLLKLHSKICLKKKRMENEQLLKEKIRRIQNYIQKKYPSEEVYLFAYSNDDYRNGKHGTTLESKEASGSAYELILNYEVLMPGIQFTPTIPIHFLMPGSVNSNRSRYESIVEKIRFNFINLYNAHRKRLVDLGSTPPLTSDYMVAHSGAIYWESFKASSGNLPKAMLNLLRLEMLFDERFNMSIIELIKNPKRLDKYAGLDAKNETIEEYTDYDFDEGDVEIIDDFYDDFGMNEVEISSESKDDEVLGEEDNPEGMTISQLIDIEEKYPSLWQDPWWLRYKALKIGFGPENNNIKSIEEKQLISRIIDLGFALHIRVSDVFANIKEGKKNRTYRENVLSLFLKKGFTLSKRRLLEHIATGEVDAVIDFENDLKYLFKRSMNRVQKYVERFGGQDKTNLEENKIWYHYYQKNFDPPHNVVRRDILSHLKVPRGRLQIGINEKGVWFFRSIQKSTLAGSRYDTFGLLDHLPDEVDLFEQKSFLHGIAHCLLNGYYGIVNKGTLKETRTHLEFSVGHTEIGKKSADRFAFIRPDIVDRLVDSIDKAFPPQEYDFRDCIYKEKEITNVFICLNLLEYGRVSFMYRDNLKNWYVDEVDHPTVERDSQNLYQKKEMILKSKFIQNTIRYFFNNQNIDFDRLSREGGITYWVNPNSISTYHSVDKYAQKEAYLAEEFRKAVFQVNSLEPHSEEENEEEDEEAIMDVE